MAICLVLGLISTCFDACLSILLSLRLISSSSDFLNQPPCSSLFYTVSLVILNFLFLLAFYSFMRYVNRFFSELTLFVFKVSFITDTDVKQDDPRVLHIVQQVKFRIINYVNHFPVTNHIGSKQVKLQAVSLVYLVS